MFKYHPDKNPNNIKTAEYRTARVGQAYTFLTSEKTTAMTIVKCQIKPANVATQPLHYQTKPTQPLLPNQTKTKGNNQQWYACQIHNSANGNNNGKNIHCSTLSKSENAKFYKLVKYQ